MPVARGPIPIDLECTGCPLAIDGKPVRPVRGYGEGKPRFVVISDVPGRREIQEGLPLIGDSGVTLNKALAACKVERRELYVTQLCLCMPTTLGKDRDKEVTLAAEHCHSRLIRELETLEGSPPLLVLGKHAASKLIKADFGITELAGSYHELQLGTEVHLKKVTEEYFDAKDVLRSRETGEVEVVKDELRARPLGHEPTSSLVHWHPEPKVYPAIPTVHPAAINRGADGGGDNAGAHASDLAFWGLLYDVGKIRNIADGTAKVFSKDIEIAYGDADVAEALLDAMIAEILVTREFACDTETSPVAEGDCHGKCYGCEGHSALEPMHARITAIGLATVNRSISIEWRSLSVSARAQLRALLADPTLQIWFHNRGYDEVVLECHGFPVKNKIGCTQFLHHNSFPGLSHKLQRVATQFLVIPPWKAEYRHGDGTLDELLTYNALDTLATMRLVAPLKAAVTRVGGWKTYEVDMRKQDIAKKMQLRGVPIDLYVNSRFKEYFTPIIEQAKTELRAKLDDSEFGRQFKELLCNEQAKFKRKYDSTDYLERHAKRLAELEKKWSGLNLNSTPQIAAYLKACGVPLTARTKTGKVSTSKDVLEGLAMHPAVRALLRFRGADKLYNTFVEPFLFMIDKEYRIHSVWLAMAITGRFKSSPNFQNHSKGDTEAKTFEEWDALFTLFQQGKPLELIRKGKLLTFKEVGVPNLRWQVRAKKGRRFTGADFAAIEARIIAQLAPDAWLCQMFSTDADVHAYFATEAFEEFKQIAFGYLDQMLSHTLAATYVERLAEAVAAKTVEPGKTAVIVSDLCKPFGITKSSEWKFYRDLEKRCLYGYLYQAQVMTVWTAMMKELPEGVTVPIEHVARLFKIFAKKMPSVPQLLSRLIKQVIQTGKITSAFNNRNRFFPMGTPDPTIIANFPQQAGAADVVDAAMIALDDALEAECPSAWILIHGHDALTVEHDDKDEALVREIMAREMPQERTVNGVTMKYSIELDSGQSWGET